MRENLKLLPNQLTLARIILLPVLWWFAFTDQSVLLGIGLILSFVTDLLDGRIARARGQTSEFGSKFDSLADGLMFPSALIWLWMLQPEMYLDHAVGCVIAIVLYFAALLVGAIKFKRFANLHLESARYGSVFWYLFAAHAFISGQYSQILFYIALGMSILSSVEELVLLLTNDKVDAHMHSIVHVWRRKHGPRPARAEGMYEDGG